MKLYFAGCENDAHFLRSLGVERALVAFSAQRRSVIRVLDVFPDVLLDSGAFSAFHSGTPIAMNDYIGFIRNRGVENYIALDVIADAEGTRTNLERMRHAQLDPIPVYHFGEPLDVLDQLLTESDYVCVGGAARKEHKGATNIVQRYFDSIFAVVRDHWPKRIHGLGVQQRWCLERYPFYSVDATTWQNGARYGTVIDSASGRQISGMRNMKPEQLKRRTRQHHDFAVWGVGHHEDVSKRTEANVRATLALEQHITNLWRGRGITFDQ